MPRYSGCEYRVRLMIVGMIELLTPRRAVGWVEIQDASGTALMVRVRDRETILAEADLKAPVKASAKKRPTASGRHEFSMDLPHRLDQSKLVGLTIEAARQGSDRWVPLSRHFKIAGGYSQSEPPLVSNALATRHSAAEALLPKASELPFWSDSRDSANFVSVEARPVFVLGAARSGTTALCVALEKATRYRGFHEGHVLDVAIRLVNAVDAHFEKKDPYISPETRSRYHLGQLAHPRFRAETIEMLRRLAAGYTTPFWFDKTPTYQMIASVPMLAQAWPHARFIFMKRRGLENMRSRARKFTRIDFPGSCRDWALIMSAWRTVRETVQGRCLELDQRTMQDDASSAAAGVGRLLDLEPSEVAAFAAALHSERPEVTDPSAKIIDNLSELGWTAEQTEFFRGICGAEMEAYGYTYNAEYCR